MKPIRKRVKTLMRIIVRILQKLKRGAGTRWR